MICGLWHYLLAVGIFWDSLLLSLGDYFKDLMKGQSPCELLYVYPFETGALVSWDFDVFL